MLEGAADGGPVGRFDAIPKDVVAHAPIVAAPRDDARPGECAPEGAGPQGPAPSRPRDDSSDDSRKGSQEPLKSFAPPGAHQKVQVRADVGKVVHAHAAPRDTSPKGFSNLRLISAHRPPTASPLAVQHHVHGTPSAHRPFELAPPAPKIASVLHAPKLGMNGRREQRRLHERSITRTIRSQHLSSRGNIYFGVLVDRVQHCGRIE